MIDPHLGAALRGEGLVWPADADPAFADALAERARDEGVHVLLLEALPADESAPPLTARLRDRLHAWAREEAFVDLVREDDLRRTLDRFQQEGIRSLLLKGGALALTHYAASHQRPRLDTDVLVAPEDAVRAESALSRLGYARYPGVTGRLIAYESTWVRPGPGGRPLQVDLHWRPSNVQGFARSFAFEELYDGAVPLEVLGPGAAAPDDVSLLFLTALHLVGNDQWGNGHRLIWLHDLRLLGRGLDEAAWDRLADLAAAKGLRTVLAAALERAQGALDLQVPERVLASLRATEAGREVSAGYVGADGRQALLTDLRALPRWRDRIRLLYEHAFPPGAYLRTKYRSGGGLLRLHARRIFEGARSSQGAKR